MEKEHFVIFIINRFHFHQAHRHNNYLQVTVYSIVLALLTKQKEKETKKKKMKMKRQNFFIGLVFVVFERNENMRVEGAQDRREWDRQLPPRCHSKQIESSPNAINHVVEWPIPTKTLTKYCWCIPPLASLRVLRDLGRDPNLLEYAMVPSYNYNISISN